MYLFGTEIIGVRLLCIQHQSVKQLTLPHALVNEVFESTQYNIIILDIMPLAS